MRVIVDSVSPDKTYLIFRDSEGYEHWTLSIQTAPYGRAYYTVYFDGWVVHELTAREVRVNDRGTLASECFATLKPRQPIPAAVLSHLPKPSNV